MNHDLVAIRNMFSSINDAKGNDKLPLVKTYAEDELFNNKLFLKVLNFVFNPMISTGISMKKMTKEVKSNIFDSEFNSPKTLEEALDYLQENKTGKDHDIARLQYFIEENHECAAFLRQVFTKDMPIGISLKSINKALGYEFIPQHDVMKGKRFDKDGHKITGDFTISLKMDDERCTIMYDDDLGWVFKSRQNKRYEGLVELEEFFEKMSIPKNLVFDGGLISTRDDLPSPERFRLTRSILGTDGPKTGIMFYLYDMLSYDDFKAGKSSQKYVERLGAMRAFLNIYTSPLFQEVEKLYTGSDKDVIMDILPEVLAEQHEGLMINTHEGYYETKRSAELQKVKEFYTCDLRVVGFKEHKRGGKLGAFICEYKDNTVNVGFGIKHEQQVDFWNRQEELLGKIIEVRYFQKSKNQNGGESIRSGGFIRLRDDKNEPSYD